ncbi:MAG: hypothetical protein Q7J36_15440 [Thiobacillus sp.]|nr:hypothetical protein [Thiobacillus sp.]
MKISAMLLVGLLSLTAAGAQAQFAGGDVLTVPKLAGTFQRYDASSRVVRISDIEYAVAPNLVSRLRDLRAGRQVVFSVSGFDPKGRDIIMEIAAE